MVKVQINKRDLLVLIQLAEKNIETKEQQDIIDRIDESFF